MVVEGCHLHGCPPSLSFGSKEIGQRSSYCLWVVFHRDVAGRLDPNEPRFRDLPCVAFGIVDRLETILDAPHQKLGRL